LILSKSPTRLGLCGGGSDSPIYFKKYGGICIGFSINKFTYVLVKKRKDNKIFLKYSENEIVDVNNINSIKHDFVKNTLKYLNIDCGLEIVCFSDISLKGTGLGSSSSFLVSLLNALYTMNGQQVSKERLAKEACHIEINMCNRNIGVQDQYWASVGGFNRFLFEKNDYVGISRYDFSDDELKSISRNILMFNTGITRESSSVLNEQNSNLIDNQKVIEAMHLNVELAKHLNVSLKNRDFDAIGRTMSKNWELKKTFSSNISNEHIDNLYNSAIQAGATGGKITGAGGGGYLILYAKPDKQENVRASMNSLGLTEEHFEIDSYGSRIIFNIEE